MTLNEVNIIKNSVLDATEAYVDARLNSSDFVKTQIGVTSGDAVVGSDGKYRHTVICNRTTNSQGVTYNNVLSVGNISFPSGSVVFMIIPNAQASNQFILGKLDTSPCNIEGGSINIGNGVFTVDNQGVVNIERGAINLGKQTDNTYNFSVTDGGIVTIKNGEIKLTYNNALQDYNFKVNSSGINLGLKGTAPTNKYYNFIVDNDGRVDIKNGSINIGFISNNKYNFSVSDTGIVYIRDGSILLGETSSGSNRYNVNINYTGLGLGYIEDVSGSPTYNFSVSSGGIVNIKKGSINLGYDQLSTSYLFTVADDGTLTAKKGTIGGATIGTNYLQYSDNSRFSRDRIGCGYAGNGIVNLKGNNGRPYIALTSSGSGEDDSFLDGTVIYGIKGSGDDVERGVVRIYNDNGSQIAERYLANIPDGDIDTIIDDRLRYYDLI